MFHRFSRLVYRLAAHQASRLHQAVYTVDVGLAQLTSVRVSGQAATRAKVPVQYKVSRFTKLAEVPGLKLQQQIGRQCIVYDRRIDIIRGEAAHLIAV